MNFITRYFNRLIFRLADKYLTQSDFRNLIYSHERLDIKIGFEELEKQRIEMEKFLIEKGISFVEDLEQQNHVAYVLGDYEHPKTKTLNELRNSKGR